MRVLYISVGKDGTGWGQAALDYMLALDAAGVDVVPRFVKLNNRQIQLPDRIRELEHRPSRGCDIVIQHLLPNQYDYNGRLTNVAMYYTETSEFPWGDRINCLDFAIVANHQQFAASRKSGVTIPIDVIPCPTNIERFQRTYGALDQLAPYKERGDFLFYGVGEWVRRKNWASLLKAFHLEFDPAEPVQLVIKSDRPGLDAETSREQIRSACNEIKYGLKLHGGRLDFYKDEIIITERLTEQGMMKLHATCDCFVQPSYGEAWSIPAFDAMGMGKTPIVTACTGFLDYMSEDCGWLVECREEPVFGVNDTFEDLFVGTETWSSVDVPHLRRCMRDAFANRQKREEKAMNGISRAYDFSYEAVGPLMRETLAWAKSVTGKRSETNTSKTSSRIRSDWSSSQKR